VDRVDLTACALDPGPQPLAKSSAIHVRVVDADDDVGHCCGHWIASSCKTTELIAWAWRSDWLYDVEAVEVHDFGPSCHEVGSELQLCVRTGVDLG
jgi:hypothetical protein